MFVPAAYFGPSFYAGLGFASMPDAGCQEWDSELGVCLDRDSDPSLYVPTSGPQGPFRPGGASVPDRVLAYATAPAYRAFVYAGLGLLALLALRGGRRR